MKSIELIRRDRDVYEIWLVAVLVPFVLSLPKAGNWEFWAGALIRLWFTTALLSRAASGKAWGRVVFGLIMALEVILSGGLAMRGQLPMNDRIGSGILAVVAAWLCARAFRLFGPMRAPIEIQQS